MVWRGVPFIISIVISLAGASIIAGFGYVAFSPLAIIIGTFIAGLLYKDERDGAVFGLASAAVCAFIIGFLFIAIFLFLLITIIGIVFIPEFVAAATNVFTINILIAVLLSPFIGAAGGFSGKKFFVRTKEFPSPTSQTSEVPAKTIFCANCGNPNVSTSKFCEKCGSSLRQ